MSASTWKDALIQAQQERDALKAEVERLQIAQQSDAVYLTDYAKKIDRLMAEVTRLRLLETLWKARVTWASVQGDGPTERANWEAYDKAREAYEAAGGNP